MLAFLRKFENHGIKIARVNSTHITKNINYFHFVWRCGSDVMSTFLNYPPVRSPLIVKVYMNCTLLKYFLFNSKNKIIFRIEDLL